jgi:hypothetical protein
MAQTYAVKQGGIVLLGARDADDWQGCSTAAQRKRSSNAATCLHNEQDDENDGEFCQVMPVGVVMGAIVMGSKMQTGHKQWYYKQQSHWCDAESESAWPLCLPYVVHICIKAW